MIDDIIDTAGTVMLAADALIEQGAREVYACCTHPALFRPAIERIKKANIKEMVVTNTIPLTPEKQLEKSAFFRVAPDREAIIRIHKELSVSKLFD